MSKVRSHTRSGRPRLAGGLACLLALALLAASALAGTASLDPTFSDDGKRLLGHSVADVVIQPDGKIVVAGPEHAAGADAFAMTRLLPDGSLDRSFDGDGTSLIGFEDSNSNWASAVALQPDGRIIVVGYSSVQRRAAIARINPDGSLDSSFDGDGKLTLASRDGVGDVLVQPDGRIVVVGFSSPDMLATRLEPDGSFDASFGAGGRSEFDFGLFPVVEAASLQADGRIVVVGWTSYGGHGTDAVAARLTADGSLDPSFDGDGRLTIDAPGPGSYGQAKDVLVQPDGRIVVVGNGGDGGADVFTVWRLNADGSFDSSFAGDGIVPVRFNGQEEGTAAVLQPDGRILAAGYGLAPDRDDLDFAVARLNANGSLDPSFDGDGKRMIPGLSGLASAIALQANGRIVAGLASGLVVRLRVGQARCRGSRATLIGTAGPNMLTGSRLRDVIVARGGDDLVRGLGGNDLICGGTGDDKLLGHGGRDRLYGEGDRDRLYGGRGNDVLHGGQGDDQLRGGMGRDREQD